MKPFGKIVNGCTEQGLREGLAHKVVNALDTSPVTTPCQIAGAAAPGEYGSVPDERAAYKTWSEQEYRHSENFTQRDFYIGLHAWQARAALGMQPPNNQPNSDHVAVISAKPDSVHLAEPAETATDPSLLPCPFCGSAKAVILTTTHAAFDLEETYAECDIVVCDASTGRGRGGCGAASPCFEGKAEAIASWNRRAGMSLPNTAGQPNEQNDVAQEGKQ